MHTNDFFFLGSKIEMIRHAMEYGYVMVNSVVLWLGLLHSDWHEAGLIQQTFPNYKMISMRLGFTEK